jgi:hypothetical protein
LRPTRIFFVALASVAIAVAAFGWYASAAHADSTYKPVTGVKFCNDLPDPFPPDGALSGGNGSGGPCVEGAGNIVGAHPDITTTLDMASGDLNFSNVVTMFPNGDAGVGTVALTTSAVSIGQEVGGLHSETRLGTLNQPCNVLFQVDFLFFNVALPNMVGGRVDTSTNISWPQPEGTSVRFGRWGAPGAGPILAGGGDPISTVGFGSLVADGTNNPIVGYPHHLVRAFDRDTVPADGGADSLNPFAVYGGLSKVAGTEWVPLYFVLFDQTGSDALSTLGHPPLSLITSAMGAPSVSVLNDPTAVQASPSTITNFCTPLNVTAMLLGTTSPGSETRATNGASAGTAFFLQYNASLRDTDQDSYENALDTCPLNVNAGNPRVALSGDADNDGIDSICDPDDTSGPNDFDGDGFDNRQDNCALVANPTQEEAELTTGDAADKGPRTDQIGDPCWGGAVAVSQNCSVAPNGGINPTPCATPNLSITMSNTVGNGRYMTVTNVVAKCIEAGLPIDQDVDYDGYCKAQDSGADGGADACLSTVPVSCATRHNQWSGATHPALQMDTDGDKQSDALETYVGTDPVQACSQTVGNNNEPMDNWMFDLNDNFSINGQDFGLYANYPLGVGGTFTVQGPFSPFLSPIIVRPGVRFDFNTDGNINGQDLAKFGGVGPYGGTGPYNTGCNSGSPNPAGIPAFSQQ